MRSTPRRTPPTYNVESYSPNTYLVRQLPRLPPAWAFTAIATFKVGASMAGQMKNTSKRVLITTSLPSSPIACLFAVFIVTSLLTTPCEDLVGFPSIYPYTLASKLESPGDRPLLGRKRNLLLNPCLVRHAAGALALKLNRRKPICCILKHRMRLRYACLLGLQPNHQPQLRSKSLAETRLIINRCRSLLGD